MAGSWGSRPLCTLNSSLSSSSDSKVPAIHGVKRSFSFNSFKSFQKMAFDAMCSTGSEVPNGYKSKNMLTRRGFSLVSTTLPFWLAVPGLEHCFASNVAELDMRQASPIQDGIRKVTTKAKAAGFLRLAFHDAGTFSLDDKSGGMNGSIIHELDRPENAGLSKSVKVLEKVKKELEKASWADIIAVAGAEAVSTCGGPVITVQLGRLDTMDPDPEGRLPLESLDAPGLKKVFLSKGFSTQELVALSGAHTLGSKGFGKPTVFDNSYFKVLLEKAWQSSDGMSSMVGLPSDRALVEDEECMRWISLYANEEKTFFEDFKKAYIKLVNLGAQWRSA